MTKFQFSRRWLLATLLALGLAIPMVGLAGKGGGGGKTDPPPEPPPVTYMISWIDGFSVAILNNHGDMLGLERPSGDYELIYDGTSYFIDDFFAETPTFVRYVNDFSERAADGSVCLCGSCDTIDGIRGWAMRLSPNESGQLKMTWFDTIDPISGHDTTSAYGINSYGETGGLSLNYNNQNEKTAIFVSPTLGLFELGLGTYSRHRITESGEWIGLLNSAGNGAYYSWTIDGGHKLLVEGFDSNNRLINNQGHMLGAITSTTTTKSGTTETVTNYFFDGQLNPLGVQNEYHYPRLVALNDRDDYLSDQREGGQGKHRYYTTIYFSDINQEFEVANLLDPSNAQADLDLFAGDSIGYGHINAAGVIVGGNGNAAFVLTPVQQ